MKKKLCIVSACAVTLLLFASCKSDDDPFADISTAKKDRPKEEKQKKGGSLLDQLDFSGSERAKRKAKLRDVSRPLNEDSKEGRFFRGAAAIRGAARHCTTVCGATTAAPFIMTGNFKGKAKI